MNNETNPHNKKKLITILSTLIILSPSASYAYMDPGTGSMLIQSIIGAIAAGAVVGKVYWFRIKMFFMGFLKKK